MEQPVILSVVRTPVGRFGGALSEVNDRTLASLVIKEAMSRAAVSPDQIEEVVFSQQYRTGVLPPNMARPVSIDAGIPIAVPEFTVAKACGGSLKTVFLAAQAIKAGDRELMVAGGVEWMSGAAYPLPKACWGYRLGHDQIMDQLVLYDPISGNTMGETAENVAGTISNKPRRSGCLCLAEPTENSTSACKKQICRSDSSCSDPGEKRRIEDFRY